MAVALDTRPLPTTNGITHDIAGDELSSSLIISPAPVIDNSATKNSVLKKEAITGNLTQKQAVPLELVDRYIDEPRALKVAVIGGGLAGILAGVLLPVKVPGIELTIYEKNHDFVRLAS